MSSAGDVWVEQNRTEQNNMRRREPRHGSVRRDMGTCGATRAEESTA